MEFFEGNKTNHSNMVLRGLLRVQVTAFTQAECQHLMLFASQNIDQRLD